VQDAVAALGEVERQAQMAAAGEDGSSVRALSGAQEVEVTDRLLAMVDETVEALEEKGRSLAHRRVEEDFESVRVSS
jgi:hypothetical protein